MTRTAPGSGMESAHAQRAKGQRSAHTITHQGVIITCIEMDEKCNERVGGGGEEEQVLIRITKRPQLET